MQTSQKYDKSADLWRRSAPESLSDFTARRRLFQICGNVSGARILDLGCGEGYCARELKGQGGGDYLGIDFSENMIAEAQAAEDREPLGITYICSDVCEAEIRGEFDLVIAVFLFNYLTSLEMESVFMKVRSHLAPGGRFIFTIPHPSFPFVERPEKYPFYFESSGFDYFSGSDKRLAGAIWKRTGDRLPVECVHKPWQTYFQTLKKAGFSNAPEIEELTVTRDLLALDKDFFGPLLGVPLHVLFTLTG